MSVTESTTVRQLIERYPYLREWLISYAPAFEKLTDPVLYATVARAATLQAAASMADVPVDQLLDHIRTRIAEHEISAQESGGGPGQPVDPEKRAERQEVLKGIIRRLHDGASVEEVKAAFDELATDVDSAEIAAMEQALIAEGMPVSEVQRLCDVHVTVFKDALEGQPTLDVDPSHPVAAYVRENEKARQIVDRLRQGLTELAERVNAGEPADEQRAEVARGLERLAAIDTHYTRKENQLFPALEAHGVEGPTKVMWGIHDELRAELKETRAHAADPSAAQQLAHELSTFLLKVEDMIYKEERILFPTALETLSAEEWQRISQGDAEIGYAWIEAPGEWRADGACASGSAQPAEQALRGTTAEPHGEPGLPITTGRLALGQLDLLFRNIPIDLTYVDENDRVAFYSEGDRVFPRSPAVIGRQVRNCHPPKSVDKVEQILEEFKAGRRDMAEFWIELSGRFVHIRYTALRDEDGTYRGCLEAVQDATHVRSLEGERRLLDW